MDEVLKYIDWFYTDEAIHLTTWGKEGELYDTTSDGGKELISPLKLREDFSFNVQRKEYGIFTNGIGLHRESVADEWRAC